mmetsp:Transcript_917/g.1028  ORF Transcript_917/g.1028 Transcript_917/m.1028 type:complete len:735 (+) Transcript_917:47-2251(+)
MPISFLSPKRIFSKNKKDSGSDSLTTSPNPPAPVSKDAKFTQDNQLPLPKLKTQNLSSSTVTLSYDSTPGSPTNGKYQDYGRLSPLRPPKFENGSGASTPGRRVLSDKVKSTPSSLVRQLREFSNSMPMNDVYSSPSLSSYRSKGSVLSHNRTITENLPPELSPVVNLIHAQRLRTYAVGNFKIPGMIENEKIWLEVEAKLTGNELAIWRPSDEDFTVESGNDEFKPKYINLIDSHISVNPKELELNIIQDFNENYTMVKLETLEELRKWVAAINLSKFEYTSLNEAFTAVMLSLKGPKLSDVHILLSQKKRFPRFEWCNLRLPQISSKWVKLYVAIIPSDSKRNGCIEIYADEKVSKKQLVAYIPNLSSIFNVYPEHVNMIDFNSIMKLNGEVYISKHFQHLFVHNEPASPSQAESSNSLSSLSRSINFTGGHSKHQSVTSASSFFNNASSPKLQDTGAKSSKTSTTSFFKKHTDSFVSTNYLYIMPIPHPGVSAIEIMIRNFIHIIDSFKLYGRPQHLNSDKTNKESLLFGIPSLPLYQYLSVENAMAVISNNIGKSSSTNWDEFFWRGAFKDYISKLYPKYKGDGNIYDLYNSLELDANEIYNYAVESPRIQFPPSGGMRSQSNSLSNLEIRNVDFDNFSEPPESPLFGNYNQDQEYNQNYSDNYDGDLNGNYSEGYNQNYSQNGALGEPIDFGSPNLSAPYDRTLDPIVDLPTPRDEIHPFKNLAPATNQ